jgi:hypothetical protein
MGGAKGELQQKLFVVQTAFMMLGCGRLPKISG